MGKAEFSYPTQHVSPVILLASSPPTPNLLPFNL